MGAKEELAALNLAISQASQLLAPHRALLERFEAERRSFDTLGPIVDPTLWMNGERRRASEILTPVYDATRGFLATLDEARMRTYDAVFAEGDH